MKTIKQMKKGVLKAVSVVGIASLIAVSAFIMVLNSDPQVRANVFFSPAVQKTFADELRTLTQLQSDLTQNKEEVAQDDAEVQTVAYEPVDQTLPLTAGQREVAAYISKRYRVSRQAIESLVRVAWHIGKQEGVEPTLILAISGIESSYNPFAASSVGAKGLMQVMANIHKDKFEALSPGDWNPLHPELNMRVGSKIIREYTRRTGSIREGLVWYVGAAIHRNDGGYPDKVLGLKSRIDGAYNKGVLLARNSAKDEQLSAVAAKATQG